VEHLIVSTNKRARRCGFIVFVWRWWLLNVSYLSVRHCGILVFHWNLLPHFLCLDMLG